jgi:DHA1 family inner membrane transport protein
MLVVFTYTTGEFVIAGILPEVAADLSVSVSAAGLLVTAYAVGMIVGGPVITVLTARLARKPLIVGLIAVSVIGNLGSALAPSHTGLLVARFVAGSVVATFFAVALATAVSIAPAGREASTVAKVTLGLNLGIILGAGRHRHRPRLRLAGHLRDDRGVYGRGLRVDAAVRPRPARDNDRASPQ